jgi:hypothetical protein
VALFGRKPLHRRLAEEGGLSLEGDAAPRTPTGHPPELDEQFFGERSLTFFERLSGEVTAPRPRRWDAVATAEADAEGAEAAFVALPDGSLLVEDGSAEDGLDPLARAVEERLRPPYRAHAVRQSGRIWAVSATRLRVEEFRAEGEELELAVTDTEATLTVDGAPSFGTIRELEQIGEAEGSTYVVRASRLDGDLWEIHSHRL